MSLAVVIGPNGITGPSYAEILASLQASYRTIYGNDIYIEPDSQDGQIIAIFAQAIFDVNSAAIFVYNNFSPATAQGAGLSTAVKINGLQRHVSSASQALVTIVGQAGTTITNGLVGDNLGLNTQWALPASVVIPVSGTIDETVTSTADGNVAAAPNSLTVILTPTLGWQTVNNAAAATLGAPIETDAQLRQRQSLSTSVPALSVLDAILGGVANLAGVQRITIVENDTDSTDGHGIPSHSFSLVVLGGDAQQIGDTIARYKTPGTGTYGSTSVDTVDSRGIPNVIDFNYLSVVQLDVHVTIKALTGYVSTTGDLLKQAVVGFINGLDIGETSYYLRLVGPANLDGDAATQATGLSQAQLDAFGKTYTVTAVTQARHGGGLAAADLAMAYNEAAACVVTNISLTVT